EGVFLNVARGQPYDLDIKNSTLFLAGTAVEAHINGPVNVMPGASKIRLDRSTFYNQDQLLKLIDDDNGKGLINTVVTANDCLFASDSSPRSLIDSNSSTKVSQLLSWGGKHNAYCAYDTIVYQQPAAGGSPLVLKVENWTMKESSETVFPTETF